MWINPDWWIERDDNGCDDGLTPDDIDEFEAWHQLRLEEQTYELWSELVPDEDTVTEDVT